MSKHAQWMIWQLERGNKVTGVFDYRRLETVRETLEAKYKHWGTEIRIKDGMMELTPIEAFIKR